MSAMPETPETVGDAVTRLFEKELADGFEFVASHAYRDANGEVLFYRPRLKHPNFASLSAEKRKHYKGSDKVIRPMHLNGEGRFSQKEPDFPQGKKPLYHLDKLEKHPGMEVFVVEGEQKADALLRLKILATTSGGSTSADGVDWSPLAGRTVTIWWDNDKAGKRYAEAVAAILTGLGCKVRVVDVAALELPEKGDVVDWLKLNPGATKEDVLALPASEVNGWPAPQPLLARVEPEPFPIDALPVTLREAVEEVQAFVRAPVPLVASCALSALSVAAQGYVDVKRDSGLVGPSGVYIISIADSGERKTKCDSFFAQAIRDYDAGQEAKAKDALDAHASAITAWKIEREVIEAELKAAFSGKCKSGKSVGQLKDDLAALDCRKPAEPKVPRLMLTDETPEHLAYRLAMKWPVAGVISSEAGVVFGSHGMGKDSVTRNLGLLNVLWDGGELQIGRKTSESFIVRGARLTMALQVQELVLQGFFDQSGGLARGTGFMARFLVCWPESTQGTRLYRSPPAGWPKLSAFNRAITEILSKPIPVDEKTGVLAPKILELSPAAKRAWVRYHDETEVKLRSGGELYDVRDVASKSAENAARLAALFHVLEHDAPGSISVETFESASRIAAWYLGESRRFFGELALPTELANAMRMEHWLLDHCRRERTHMVSVSAIQKSGPGGLRTKAPMEAALRELDELDRARLVRGTGKARIVKFNPALLGFAAAVIDDIAVIDGERDRKTAITAKTATATSSAEIF